MDSACFGSCGDEAVTVGEQEFKVQVPKVIFFGHLILLGHGRKVIHHFVVFKAARGADPHNSSCIIPSTCPHLHSPNLVYTVLIATPPLVLKHQ